MENCGLLWRWRPCVNNYSIVTYNNDYFWKAIIFMSSKHLHFASKFVKNNAYSLYLNIENKIKKPLASLDSLRVNCWEIDQVISKCQIDFLSKTCRFFKYKLAILIFWIKFAQKGYFRSKINKVNTTFEFCIFILIKVPNFRLN